MSHVKSRAGVSKNNLSNWDFDTFRKARTFDEKQFDKLKTLIQDIFKDHASLSRGTLSSSTMKELRSWADTSGRYYNAFIQQKKQPQRTAFSELSLDPMTKNYLVTLNAPICG
jgi:hypothetical protein